MDAVLAAAIMSPLVVLVVAVLIGRWLRSVDQAQEQQRAGAMPPSVVRGEPCAALPEARRQASGAGTGGRRQLRRARTGAATSAPAALESRT